MRQLRESLYFDERTKTVPKSTVRNGIIEDIVQEGEVFFKKQELMNSIYKLKQLNLLKTHEINVMDLSISRAIVFRVLAKSTSFIMTITQRAQTTGTPGTLEASSIQDEQRLNDTKHDYLFVIVRKYITSFWGLAWWQSF